MKRRRPNESSSSQQSRRIDLLPCTNNVNHENFKLAEKIIDESLPKGYQRARLFPLVVTGRHPHRWLACYTRNDNVYSAACGDLQKTKEDFRDLQPAGSTITNVGFSMGDDKFIVVEYHVNCTCTL